MSLDSDLLLSDSKGVIPFKNETPEKLVDRAIRMISRSDIGDIVAYVERRLRRESEFDESVSFPNPRDKRVIAKAVKNIDKRFGCDYSWLIICYANMMDGDEVHRGHAYAPRAYLADGTVKYEPPFVVVNSAILDKKGTYLHELIHMPFQISTVDDIFYKGWRAYNERLANEATLRSRILSPLKTNPKVDHEFAVVKRKLRRSFGRDAGYVLVRTPYEEARDFYYEGSKDPKEIISVRAEQGLLRYQIMKQKLRL